MKSNKIILIGLLILFVFTVILQVVLYKYNCSETSIMYSYIPNIQAGIFVSLVVTFAQYLHYFYQYKNKNKNIMHNSYFGIRISHDNVAILRKICKEDSYYNKSLQGNNHGFATNNVMMYNNQPMLLNLQNSINSVLSYYYNYNYNEYEDVIKNKKIYQNIECEIYSIQNKLYRLNGYVIEAINTDLILRQNPAYNAKINEYCQYIEIIDKTIIMITDDIGDMVYKYVDNCDDEAHKKWKNSIDEQIKNLKDLSNSFKVENYIQPQ